MTYFRRKRRGVWRYEGLRKSGSPNRDLATSIPPTRNNQVQQVKGAEGQAAVRVLQAKGESDAIRPAPAEMRNKFRESKLGSPEAGRSDRQVCRGCRPKPKLIDSKAEGERRKLLAQAEAERIRLTPPPTQSAWRARRDPESQNPLLINKIVAERLSDKLQVMIGSG